MPINPFVAVHSTPDDCAAATKLVPKSKLKSNFENSVSEEIINRLALMFVDHVGTQENSNRKEDEGRSIL